LSEEKREEKAISRRKYLGAIGGVGAAAAVGWGLAGYLASRPPAPAAVRTVTETKTETKTVMGTVTAATEKPGKGLRFRCINHGMARAFFIAIKKGWEEACNWLGVEQETVWCESDINLQVARIKEAIAEGVDGISTALVVTESFKDVVKEAMDKGIPVVSHNIDDPGTERLAFTGQNFITTGYMIGRKMIEKYGLGKGDHVLLSAEFPTMTYAIERGPKGVGRALDEVGATWELLESTADWATAEERITSYLQGHPETTAMIGLGEIPTGTMGKVAEKLGYKPEEMPIGGFDTGPVILEYVKKGYIYISADQQPFLQGYIPAVQLYLYCQYKFMPDDYDTGKGVITKENAEEYEKFIKMGVKC